MVVYSTELTGMLIISLLFVIRFPLDPPAQQHILLQEVSLNHA